MFGRIPNIFGSKRFLVAGDLMLDEYLFCEFTRISPEAPVPVYNISGRKHNLGGAGNVAANLIALGGEVDIIGHIGDDRAGKKVLSCLQELRINPEHLIISREYPTITKTRVMAGRGYQALRIDNEKKDPPCGKSVQKLCAFIKEAIKQYDCVVLSDYGKGMLTDGLLKHIISAAGSSGVPLVVDPKGNSYRRYEGAAVCTPNLKELEIACGREIRGDRELDKAARDVLEVSGIKNMVVTRGPCGISLYSEHRQWRREDFPAARKDIADVTGAGDTVVAVIAVCLADGIPLEKACAMANAAASLVVSRTGVTRASMTEIVSAMNHELKCFQRHTLAALVDRCRKEGKKIVFTNGCFDLLHTGHVKLLKSAGEMGDILVVGLNSDASVKRIKGPLRPVNNESIRAELLSGLSFVDFVTVFDEDTPEELIRVLKPDVLVKGADWQAGEIIGGDIVESSGGTVRLVDLEPGISTTGIIDRIVNSRLHKRGSGKTEQRPDGRC
ncbi:MAG: D-glycero-beta-D-manno-heptose 1-phosphate adenylyltransferase [Firmicutes bacterium]|nr:D-glycero-beta-D-manno-heptose 1-phosphate adenylyltransferase [Bacillota bacterium]